MTPAHPTPSALDPVVADLREKLAARTAASQEITDAVHGGWEIPANKLFMIDMHLSQAAIAALPALLDERAQLLATIAEMRAGAGDQNWNEAIDLAAKKAERLFALSDKRRDDLDDDHEGVIAETVGIEIARAIRAIAAPVSPAGPVRR